jgi:hypothetical protein
MEDGIEKTNETDEATAERGKMIFTIVLFLTSAGQNQCKLGDSAFVQGLLMEASCAQLQYSTSTVNVRHARECLRHTSKEVANFAVLERGGSHKLWHVDPTANTELVRYFDVLQEQTNVTVSVWGSVRKDPGKGDIIKACAISVGK